MMITTARRVCIKSVLAFHVLEVNLAVRLCLLMVVSLALMALPVHYRAANLNRLVVRVNMLSVIGRILPINGCLIIISSVQLRAAMLSRCHITLILLLQVLPLEKFHF